MEKISKALLRLVSASFIVSFICTMSAYIGYQLDIRFPIFGIMGFYGTIITVWLAILQFLSFLIVRILRSK